MRNPNQEIGLRSLTHSHTGKGTSILKRIGLMRLSPLESYDNPKEQQEDDTQYIPRIALCLIACVLSFLIMRNEVFAQANRTNTGDITCPATGTSIEILPPRSSRYSYFLNNVTGIAVFIGNNPSGTGALTGTSGSVTSAWRLQPGQAFADSAPNVVSLRVVCMSTTASSATISFGEAYK